METISQFLVKLNIHLSCDLVISLLDIYPNEIKAYVNTKTYTWIFIVAFFKIWKTGNNPNVLQLLKGQRNWHLHTTEDYSTIKINELQVHTVTLTDTDTLCQAQEAIFKRLHAAWFHFYVILEILRLWGQKIAWWLPRAGGGGRGWPQRNSIVKALEWWTLHFHCRGSYMTAFARQNS